MDLLRSDFSPFLRSLLGTFSPIDFLRSVLVLASFSPMDFLRLLFGTFTSIDRLLAIFDSIDRLLAIFSSIDRLLAIFSSSDLRLASFSPIDRRRWDFPSLSPLDRLCSEFPVELRRFAGECLPFDFLTRSLPLLTERLLAATGFSCSEGSENPS